MSEDRGNRRFRMLPLWGLLAIAPVVFGQSNTTDPKVKAEVLDKVATIINERAYVPGIDFSRWPSFLQDEKSEIDAAKTDEDFQKAINTALHKFGASHVMLMTPRIAQIRRTGSTVGIGVSTQMVPEGLLIVRTIKDGPADKTGILTGDTIVEVDGKPASGVKGLTGEPGSEVLVKVKHADGKMETMHVIRQKYSTVRQPELTWIDKDTVQLKIASFETGYDRSQIVDLMSQASSAKNLILDLRYNGGGAVTNLQHLLGMLVPENKPLGTFVRKSMVNDFVAKTGGKPNDLSAIAQWSDRKFRPFRRPESPFFGGKVAVLINSFSGSASEIAAAGLRDVMGAPVIGKKSAGAVLASIIAPASNGFLLQFPIEDYVTIKGVRLEGNGVVPDFEIADNRTSQRDGRDLAVERAVTYFAQAR